MRLKSVAIGGFDGMHPGHQALINKADAVVVIERNSAILTPGAARHAYTSKPLFFYQLSAIKRLTPDAFIALLKRDFPHLKRIVVGFDFAFGHQKSGTIAMLKEAFDEVEVISEVLYENQGIHTRYILEAIKANDLDYAAKMLSRPVEISGYRQRGQGEASQHLFATVNLDASRLKGLFEGVYLSQSAIGDGEFYPSITFVGSRSSDEEFVLESHIIDNNIKVEVGQKMRVRMVEFMRKNRSFDSFEALSKQVYCDIENARSLHAKR